MLSQFARETDWQQAALYALPKTGAAPWLEATHHYPLYFETNTLPFPIAGMSDDMPYPSTIYHQMTDEQIDRWRDAFRQQLQRIRDEFAPDIVICHHLWLLANIVLDVFPDLPVIAISHGTDIRQAKQNPCFAKRHVGSLKRLRLVLALSMEHEADLCHLFDLSPEQIVVTGGAIDTSLFHPSLPLKARAPQDPVRLLYAGKMADSKGIFELVDAFFIALQTERRLTLDLVGRESDALRTYIKRRQADDSAIRLFDVESQAHLAEHFRRSDVFCFPSFYEGLGLVALEALASGLSLVVNELPPLRHQLGDLAKSRHISWLRMPPLQRLDRIDPAARDGYVASLAAAIESQARLRRSPALLTEHPYLEMSRFSWRGLAKKVASLIGALITA